MKTYKTGYQLDTFPFFKSDDTYTGFHDSTWHRTYSGLLKAVEKARKSGCGFYASKLLSVDQSERLQIH